MEYDEVLMMKQRVIGFLNSIGLQTAALEGAGGFVPGILIKKGIINFDIEVASIADLLHEAGHIAITPPEYRHLMSKALFKGMRLMVESIEGDSVEIDSPLFKAIMQCTDTEATAWAYAAGMQLQIPPNKIIDSQAYDGTGAYVLQALQLGCYPGINGLHHSGMSIKGSIFAKMLNKEPYPEMLRWTQPHGLSKSRILGQDQFRVTHGERQFPN